MLRKEFTSPTRDNPCMCGEHKVLSLSFPNWSSLTSTPQLCQLQWEPWKQPQSVQHCHHHAFMGKVRSLKKLVFPTYLLFTSVTAQQSPCFTSGRPRDGTTTPGSMRSMETHIIFTNTIVTKIFHLIEESTSSSN